MPDLTTLFQAGLAWTGNKSHISWDFYLSWLSGNVVCFLVLKMVEGEGFQQEIGYYRVSQVPEDRCLVHSGIS